MKYILLAPITFCLFKQAYLQNIERQTLNHLVRIWGEVLNRASEHQGKGGLVLLKLPTPRQNFFGV